MNCLEWKQQLDLYVDGALDEAQKAQFEAHARECESCRRELKAAEQLRDILSQMDDEMDVPLKAQAAWRNAVRAEAKKKRMKRIYGFCGAAAAVCVLTLGVTSMLNAQPTEEARPMVARVASDGVESEEGLEAQPMSLQGRSAPIPDTIQRVIYVEDVQKANDYLCDIVAEYEGEVVFESEEGGAKSVSIQIAGENAEDFLNAAEGIGSRTDGADLTVDASEPMVDLCIVIEAE